MILTILSVASTQVTRSLYTSVNIPFTVQIKCAYFEFHMMSVRDHYITVSLRYHYITVSLRYHKVLQNKNRVKFYL